MQCALFEETSGCKRCIEIANVQVGVATKGPLDAGGYVGLQSCRCLDHFLYSRCNAMCQYMYVYKQKAG